MAVKCELRFGHCHLAVLNALIHCGFRPWSRIVVFFILLILLSLRIGLLIFFSVRFNINCLLLTFAQDSSLFNTKFLQRSLSGWAQLCGFWGRGDLCSFLPFLQSCRTWTSSTGCARSGR